MKDKDDAKNGFGGYKIREMISRLCCHDKKIRKAGRDHDGENVRQKHEAAQALTWAAFLTNLTISFPGQSVPPCLKLDASREFCA
jgi:hypothetical protein